MFLSFFEKSTQTKHQNVLRAQTNRSIWVSIHCKPLYQINRKLSPAGDRLQLPRLSKKSLHLPKKKEAPILTTICLYYRAALIRPTQRQQRRTLLDTKNTILEQQRAIQKGATPYLRGAEDPTYLRLNGDKTIFMTFMGLTALGWTLALYSHIRMWVGNKE